MKKALFAGQFASSALIDDKSYYSKGSQDILAFCIRDIEIFRGPVSSGPYCAGDSFKIPYAIDGTFDTANHFIAQLSDEQGNFTGNERELGRIKSNSDSVIHGTLPLFDVISSGAYRIRIISTKPVVQSYYKSDTLRLLIYSKDTANAGRDTTLCSGNKALLSTTGGSRWQWSPGSAVSDSTLRQPIFEGGKTTNLSVIISDSSGCGITDTAYKTMYVLQPLQILNLDTIVCKDQPIVLSMNAYGGKPESYQYQWYDTGWNLLSNENTLKYLPNSKDHLHLVLSDNCTTLNDSVSIMVNIPNKISATVPNDSTVCVGTTIKINIQSTGGLGNYSTKWITPIDTITGGPEKLSMTLSKDESFRFQIKDGCNVSSDTGMFTYYIPKALDLLPILDTFVCMGSETTFKPNPMNGIAPYKSLWKVSSNNRDSFYSDSTLKVTFLAPSSLSVLLTDICGTQVSDTFSVFTFNPLSLTYQGDSLVCKGSIATIKASVTGGKNPNISLSEAGNVLNDWNRTSIDTSILMEESRKFQLISTDNCTVPSDTLQVNIGLHKNLNADFDWIPSDPTIYDTLILLPFDTSLFRYRWSVDRKLEADLTAPGIHNSRKISEGSITLQLVATSNENCIDSTEHSIHFIDGAFIFIPSSFSPNDDGLNDVFKPVGKSVYRFQINIFDRFQAQIFDGEPNEPWSGINTRSGHDRYLYIIEVITEFGKKYELKGMVTLVK